LKRDQAFAAVVNLGIACDRIQAAHYELRDDVLIKQAQTIQTLILSLSEDVKKLGRIKPEQPSVYKAAFPRATMKHL
jgi:hypothetical protein